MGYIESFIPGQISLPNYDDPATPPGGGGGGGGGDVTAFWDNAIGQYAKIEGYQVNWALSASNPHMPYPYLPGSTSATHVDSIFGELDRKKWLRGILLEIEWGRIETSPGTFNWTLMDFVFNTVRTLPKATGQNKKIIMLFNFRNAGSLEGLEDFIPADLMTQPSANGGYYKNTASFPPAQTNPRVNAKKYDHVWCYEAKNPNIAGGVLEPRGYNFNLYKFAAAAGTNTLKTRFYAFLAALATRYGDDDVLAGIATTEAAIGAPFVAYEAGNSRDANYEGRWNILKHMKTLFPNRMVAECANFDWKYYNMLTAAGATDGMIVNKISFTTANLHTGTNMNLGNINPVLNGKVPIMMQVQPLDMWSMTGNQQSFYNYPTNPSQIINDGSDGINNNDPPTAQWMFNRVKYFNANICIFQRNYDTSLDKPAQGIYQLNWPRWKTFMDNNYANDEYGGLVTAKPQFVY